MHIISLSERAQEIWSGHKSVMDGQADRQTD